MSWLLLRGPPRPSKAAPLPDPPLIPKADVFDDGPGECVLMPVSQIRLLPRVLRAV